MGASESSTASSPSSNTFIASMLEAVIRIKIVNGLGSDAIDADVRSLRRITGYRNEVDVFFRDPSSGRIIWEPIEVEVFRRVREIEDRLRIAKESQKEEERRREQLRQQRQKEIEEEEERRREEEQKRLELEAELCRRRGQLFNYKFGDKTRLDNFLGLEIDDVTQLRIGVFGPTGSGKSCFINTCERAVRQTEKGSAPDSTTGQEGTITLQDYLPEMFFHLVDTRGFFNYSGNENIEFQNILYGKVQPGDNVVRPVDNGARAQEMHQSPAFGQRLHGIIIVVKANDPRLKGGGLKDYLKPVRDILRKNGIAPITVVTHRDTIKSEDDFKDAFNSASAATGSSPSHTFFMWNYTKENKERNPEIERMTFDILHHVLVAAERAVKIMKQKEKNKQEDELMKALEGLKTSENVVPDFAEAPVKLFLHFLQNKYQWPDDGFEKAFEKLAREDVTSVGLLAECWNVVKKRCFPDARMREIVVMELRKQNMIYADAPVVEFLGFLGMKYEWSKERVDEAVENLAKEDITSIGLLAECWSVVQNHCFPDAEMRKKVQVELGKRNMIPS